MEYDFVDVGGRSVAYKMEGAGAPMVLLHGWPQSSHMWRKVVPALAVQHRVILLDLPGLGESQSHGAFDTGSVAGIIAQALQALGIANYHLVGHDIGAWVATSLALQFESRLKSLTVVDAGIPGLIPDEIFKPGNAQRVWQFYFHAVADIPELLTEGREKEYLSWYFRNKSVVQEAISDSDKRQRYCPLHKPVSPPAGHVRWVRVLPGLLPKRGAKSLFPAETGASRACHRRRIRRRREHKRGDG